MKIILSTLGAVALAICIAQCSSSPIENPTNLIDLPVEVQMMIYKDLNLPYLIQLARMHPHNQAAVELSFKDKYSELKFNIGEYDDDAGEITLNKIAVEVIEFEKMLETFELFGHLIRKLRVSYRSFRKSTDKRRMLNEHINKYLSESLTEIELEHLYADYLMGLQGPFTKGHSLKLASNTISTNNTDFSKMFPVLQQLTLYGMKYVNPTNLAHHFPHLEFIEFSNWIYRPIELSKYERILKLNPQLRHLKFFWANLDILEMVSKNAPNLERLSMHELDASHQINRENIYFNNLKAMTIQVFTLMQAVERIPIVFGNLEEFICWNSLELWFDIIVQNKQIKLLKTGDLGDEEIKQITGKFPNLEEFTFRIHTDSTIGAIQKFVEQANKLKKFSVYKDMRMTGMYNVLISQLTPEWNAITEGQELIFLRD